MCIDRSIQEYRETDNIPREHLLDIPEELKWLKAYYGVKTDDELRRCSDDDWRVCLPAAIAGEDGAIPRTPKVLMTDDPNWFGLEQLAARLRTLINGA